jgi:hypothetical protein
VPVWQHALCQFTNPNFIKPNTQGKLLSHQPANKWMRPCSRFLWKGNQFRTMDTSLTSLYVVSPLPPAAWRGQNAWTKVHRQDIWADLARRRPSTHNFFFFFKLNIRGASPMFWGLLSIWSELQRLESPKKGRTASTSMNKAPVMVKYNAGHQHRHETTYTPKCWDY